MRKNGFPGSLILFIATAVASGVIALLFLTSPFIRSPRPNPGEIVSQIREIQSLVTQEYTYRDVVYFDEETRVLGMRTGGREILFAVEISVVAGVDMSDEVTMEHGRGREMLALVTVPSPRVLRVDAREETIDQYFVREGFRGIDWVDVSTEVEAAKERNRTDAIERGILVDAEEQAATLIRDILVAAGYETVEVRFRPPENRELRG
jgi:hypothetical protein